VHVDSKKLGCFWMVGKRIPHDGVHRNRKAGWQHAHVAVDDHSRWAWSNCERPRRRSTLPTVDAAIPTITPMRCGPAWVRSRTATISSSTAAASLRGWRLGVDGWSRSAAQPPRRYRSHSRYTVERCTPDEAAASSADTPCSTTLATTSQRDSHDKRFRRGRAVPLLSIPGLPETTWAVTPQASREARTAQSTVAQVCSQSS
jgi:hypothetical protein